MIWVILRKNSHRNWDFVSSCRMHTQARPVIITTHHPACSVGCHVNTTHGAIGQSHGTLQPQYRPVHTCSLRHPPRKTPDHLNVFTMQPIPNMSKRAVGFRLKGLLVIYRFRITGWYREKKRFPLQQNFDRHVHLGECYCSTLQHLGLHHSA